MDQEIGMQIMLSRARAAQCRGRAKQAISPAIVRELESLAQDYEREAFQLEERMPILRNALRNQTA